MDLEVIIREHSNPVIVNDLVNIINIFEDLDYDEHMVTVYDKIEEALENDSVNVGIFIHSLIIKSVYDILGYFSLKFNLDTDITINELYQILKFHLLIENIDRETAIYIVDTLEVEEDMNLSFATIVSKYTTIPSTRLYTLIDEVSLAYVNTLNKLCNDIIERTEEAGDDIVHNLIRVIKELNTDNYELAGLRYLRSEFASDKNIVMYVQVTSKFLIGTTPKHTALNFISLLILSTSRHNLVETYREYCEDMLDDENYKMSVYKEFNKILPNIDSLYIKHGIPKDV